ncbi:hypothetical protein VE23_25210 [Paenibacillus sp. D9]|uniref:hypothetical protein n=1 Tax=Paenibacillus sp. D9 TaxID=665792 RepID=UPI00061FE0BC|nr:hypothetical protein [Paenibacillus sp. D9]KKC45823.1 hypothetical protein VE23_25210 [Paenibacillus sp. D9]
MSLSNYWFLYLPTTGRIIQGYLGDAEKWTNIPAGLNVLGPFPQESAPDIVASAQKHIQYYLVQQGTIVERPNIDEIKAAEEAEMSKPAPKTPDQLRIEQLEQQLAQQSGDMTSFMEYIAEALGAG